MANPIHMEKANKDLVEKYKEVYGYKTLEGTLGTIFEFVKENEFALNEFFEKKLGVK